MIIRPLYLNLLRKYKDVPLVKILAGVRRCGKSTLLAMLRENLLQEKIPQDHIITINYTLENFDNQLTAQKMLDNLRAQIIDKQKYYLLLDEVQEVSGWEKVVNALLEEQIADIYVSGSNSKMLAGEISTYLTGRYILIPVYTLSFAEYLSFKTNTNSSKKELLDEYIRLGGFPIIALKNYEENTAYKITEDIYNSVVTSDITKRHNITNFALFNSVVKYVIENVGKTFSANAISNFLKSERRVLSVELIYNYLAWLEQAFVIYRCPRYDIQGKAVLKTQEKFYLTDSSLKYAILGFNPKSIASMLENIVYFELKRRGYNVYVGKIGNKEVDFLAIKRDDRIYVQVCKNLPPTSEREISNLLSLVDQYPKYVVTLDEFATGNINGVIIMHLADFLLKDKY